MNRSFMAMLALMLTFFTFSCQDEIDVLEPGPNESETITATSIAATLMQRTSANDGSSDNIIDKFSCGEVQLPVTVSVNGLEITIDSEEDLEIVEEIFDEYENDEDLLEIFFPIVITLGDFTEITLNNQDELDALIDECEGEEDEDIECIDFKYPITFFTYDANNQQTGEVVIESDRQMHLFFKELGENDRVALQFPVTLVTYDGSEIVVDSNAEMIAAINEAKDMCDEDDDNDHNDDDFDKERLDNYLVECSWLVYEVKRANVDQTDQYRDVVFDFKEDGSVYAKFPGSGELEGTWETRVGDNGILIKMNFTNLSDFTLEWKVYELEPGKIKLYGDDGNKIIMKRDCERDHSPEKLREILKECAWVIRNVKYDGEEVDRLLGWEFKFQAEGVVTLSNGVNVSEGSWEISETANGELAIALSFGSEEKVTFEWPLRELTEKYIRFEVQDYQLIVERHCEDDIDDDVVYIREILSDGDWMVAKHTKGDENDTEVYAEYVFGFDANQVLAVTVNQDPIIDGLWKVYRDCDSKLRVVLNFGEHDILSEFNHRWKFVSIEEGRLELKIYNEINNQYEVLVLEKL